MADISVSAPGGIPLTIKQSPTGELYAVSSNYPGAAGDGSGGPGNFGSGLITTETLDKGIAEVDVLIKDRLEFISQCKGNLIKLQLNPTAVLGTGYEKASYDFYVNQQSRWIEAGEQFIRSEQSVIETMTYLRDNQDSIRASYAQANPDSNIKGATAGPDIPATQSNSNEDTPAKTTGNAPVDPTSDPSLNSVNGADVASDQVQAQKAVPESPTGPAYDDEGNLMPGWSLDDENNPVWIGPGYIDATGETIQPQKTIPEGNVQGPAYDDEGNLMPGWSLDEENNPVWVGNNKDGTVFVEPATQASAAATRASVQGLKAKTQSQAVQRNSSDFAKAGDWRVRLSLAPGADYLYKSPFEAELGILAPLKATDGIIFPYTPSISVAYNATYDNTELTHNNYKMYQYKASSVDNIVITCDFTAQDTQEANYLLATIHFLRTITKMFYGQDKGPAPGTPPPLVYLTGLGAFQFDRHPLAITNFNYTLPNEVDYIRAGKPASPPGVATNTPAESNKPSLFSQVSSVASRLFGSNLLAGAQKAPPQWKTTQTGKVNEPTYVPTKMSIQITAVPIVSRGDISNRFSVTKYGTGELLRGSKNNTGGIW